MSESEATLFHITFKRMCKSKILHCQCLCMSYSPRGGAANYPSTLIHYTARLLLPTNSLLYSNKLQFVNAWPYTIALKHHLISSFSKFLFSWFRSTYPWIHLYIPKCYIQLLFLIPTSSLENRSFLYPTAMCNLGSITQCFVIAVIIMVLIGQNRVAFQAECLVR